MTCTQFILLQYNINPLNIQLVGTFETLSDIDHFLFKVAGINISTDLVDHYIFNQCYCTQEENGIIWVSYEIGYPINEGYETLQEIYVDASHGNPWECLCFNCESIISNNSLEYLNGLYPDLDFQLIIQLLAETVAEYNTYNSCEEKTKILAKIYRILVGNPDCFSDEMLNPLIRKISDMFTSVKDSNYIPMHVISMHYIYLLASQTQN